MDNTTVGDTWNTLDCLSGVSGLRTADSADCSIDIQIGLLGFIARLTDRGFDMIRCWTLDVNLNDSPYG